MRRVAAVLLLTTALAGCGGDDSTTEPPNVPTEQTCTAVARPPGPSNVTAVRVFPALAIEDVTAMVQAPGDDARWFALEKPGRIVSFVDDPNVADTQVVLDITDKVDDEAEGGLLSLAFHPDFVNNGRAILYYTGDGAPMTSYLSEFTSFDGGETLSPESERVLFSLPQTSTRHKAGGMAFGADGLLYLSIGDGTVGERAQDLFTLFGKFIRVDVDGGTPYGIPADNPFADGVGGLPEIIAWGFRNPWRWNFDRATGEIWAGDVGKDSYEEIDKVVIGGNYGWPIREGAHCAPPAVTCDTDGFIDPVAEYSHDEGSAVIGGFVYHGSAIPELRGTYIYADLTSRVWALSYDDSGAGAPQVLIDGGLGDRGVWSFAETRDGELYLIQPNQILQLVRDDSSQPADAFPTRLSETGCALAADATQPAESLMSYTVKVPFWSDGADKERWMALPSGAQIAINDDGDWDLPIGSVIRKDFHLNGRLIETRLLMHHDDGGWAGYSYEWDDDGLDATLLDGAKNKTIDGQTYTYPSRAQCLQCHTTAAGGSLGLETQQMNTDNLDESTGQEANQIVTLEGMGLFAQDPGDPARLPALPDPFDETLGLEERALAYLHVNCSQCHRPDGGGLGPADFRFGTLESTHVCGAEPEVDDLGVEGAKLLLPGDPERSIVYLRLASLGPERMPPIGKNVLDERAVALVRDYIASLSSCE